MPDAAATLRTVHDHPTQPDRNHTLPPGADRDRQPARTGDQSTAAANVAWLLLRRVVSA